ncbi:FAD-binding oxidoreductase [Anaeromyxobacter sp. Fw109-5]|uniref:FAD-binding oxidoreductase n=1 Tax=Anaeromyxobacter sp. (strain Fw109-5) TaxID=404589 RepID=UPI0000ED7D5A|nr:FAD-binding oxidoreductase [Anaeromyxobacter sp. Fw109-5]ABS25810.1 FAD linked oxidase domain protein [Anaeromyxobacter sp. Fw109-5]
MANVMPRNQDRALTPELLAPLREQLRGALCLPGESGYEQARTLWNAMIDRHPAAVVRAAGAADVMRAVAFAREHDVLLSVRGGGHNIAGNAVCEGGLTIDLTPMKSVRVDPGRRTARVEPGVTLGELDRETQAFGLVTPVGVNSTTGVAGLTLGGGFGWTSRKLGLTVDNLISADVVTADGRLLHASEDENADLFWAIRGGGGNFGVVTSFEFRLHPLGPTVLAGLVIHPFARARELLGEWRRIVAAAPDELTAWVVLRKAPPLPFLPAEVHGTEILVLAMCWTGNVEDGQKALAPLRALGKPHADVVGPVPFVAWQSALDPLLTPGARNYWKSHELAEVGDGALDVLVDHAGRLPTPECEVFLGALGGAVSRVPADATAYPHRDVPYFVNVHTRWRDPAEDSVCVGWARALFDALAPHATGGVYVNFMPEDEAQRVRPGAYGANYDRLARIKAKYDPDNLFHLNQNIRPAG